MLLWLLVAVLLIRGVSDVLAPRTPEAAGRSAPAARPAWPDDEARAFAVAFARGYLSYSPRDPEGWARAVKAFVADDVVDDVVPQFGRGAKRQVVGAATVARTAVLDSRHALVTVAVDDGRYLTVPVARGVGGGLVVYDLPSFAAPPARAAVAPASLDPLSGPDQGEIRDVLTRFFRAFLGGDARELAYYVPAGVRMGALGRRDELVGDVSVMQAAGAAAADRREVVVTLRARDVATGAVFDLSYRLRLVRSDRWLVAQINDEATTH
jgi:Conjugative transposon protein TcpC